MEQLINLEHLLGKVTIHRSINKVISMKRVFCIICIVIICSVYVIAASLVSKEHFSKITVIDEKGEYLIHQEELVPREDITSFIVDEGRIYVFYDEAALVNVYLLDGSFVYGLQICTFENGHGDIAMQAGKLYIKSRKSIIYVFQDSKLIEKIQPSDNYQQYISTREMFSTEKNYMYEGKTYTLSAASNEIVCRDTQTTVISLPQKSILGENMLIIATFSLGVMLYVFSRSHIG